MSKSHHPARQGFEKAFEAYVEAYMQRRDLSALTDMLHEDFCGFGTALDESYANKAEGLAIFKRDIETAPQALEITWHDKNLTMLDCDNALMRTRMDLATEIAGQAIKLNELRMLMSFHRDPAGIRITAIHISFPSAVHGSDESYPLKELEERASVLRKMVTNETRTIQEAYQELSQLLNTDALTDLSSRRYLETQILHEWQRFQRFDRSFSLLLLDFDDFKAINDNYGHAAGDKTLQQAANAILAAVRDTDIAGRWGGDEILILMPECDLDQTVKIDARIRREFRLQDWLVEPISFSAGAGQISRGESPQNLFLRIDKALYEAKRSGKGRLILATEQ